MDLRQLTPDLAVTPQIQPEDLPALAEAGFRVLINNRPDSEVGPGEDDAAMRAALNCIRRTARRGGPARVPVILHPAHPGKTGAITALGPDRGAFARNSKVIHMWARAQINLFRDPSHPDGEDGDWLVVSCGKVSDGRPFSTFGIRLCPVSAVA